MFDLDKIVNEEIYNAYLQGRKDFAEEIRKIFITRNPSNIFEVDTKISDKIFKELSNY